MAHLYKELRVCECGYNTRHRSNFASHLKLCKSRKIAPDPEKELLREQLAIKDQQLAAKDEQIKQQLAAKDEQIKQQLAAKDRQIEQLIKRPRTVNNRFVLNNRVNCFGRETLDHIPDAKYQELLRDPETSVAKVVALQRAVPENDNVAIPNVRDKRWLVVEEEDGEKQWKSKDKGVVLEQIWESSTCLLEGEADEETPVGVRWCRWADKVRSSVDSKLYREQLDMVEHCILDDQRSREHERG